mmetsp:Transcript_168477/g.409498  ORF Transcript_168477/g.409498 Transcript_168477/m.409498 type:complete len:353 (+) Transcript_168477:240-1298(+)
MTSAFDGAAKICSTAAETASFPIPAASGAFGTGISPKPAAAATKAPACASEKPVVPAWPPPDSAPVPGCTAAAPRMASSTCMPFMRSARRTGVASSGSSPPGGPPRGAPAGAPCPWRSRGTLRLCCCCCCCCCCCFGGCCDRSFARPARRRALRLPPRFGAGGWVAAGGVGRAAAAAVPAGTRPGDWGNGVGCADAVSEGDTEEDEASASEAVDAPPSSVVVSRSCVAEDSSWEQDGTTSFAGLPCSKTADTSPGGNGNGAGWITSPWLARGAEGSRAASGQAAQPSCSRPGGGRKVRSLPCHGSSGAAPTAAECRHAVYALVASAFRLLRCRVACAIPGSSTDWPAAIVRR